MLTRMINLLQPIRKIYKNHHSLDKDEARPAPMDSTNYQLWIVKVEKITLKKHQNSRNMLILFSSKVRSFLYQDFNPLTELR